jgi:hypothetical protein
MAGTVVCEECGGTFKPLEASQADLVRRCAKAKYKKLGIECPLCEEYTQINPVAVVAGKDGTVRSTPTYRCPVSACAGWVDFIDTDEDDGPYWGCGECGSIWYKQANLLKEIDKITKKFAYRKKCYRKVKGKWAPADPDKIPDTYEERVEREPEDESDEYVRG